MREVSAGGSRAVGPVTARSRTADGADTFATAITFVLGIEKEYANDPEDPGGETWWGIARNYHPTLTPWPPSREGAIQVYRRNYWNAVRGDDLPPPLAVAAFDGAVNQGARRSVLLLQAAARVKTDGDLGPVSLAALWRDPSEVLVDYLARRALLYAAPNTFQTFGRGWMRRLFFVHRLCLALAGQDVPRSSP
ncbi:MAG: hypothetical protein FJ027_20130 [Candidatus Rokubacteria bacterium]|nr:hypothetical protein [Candidatus Rokubacteria bacterium]